MPKKVSEIKKKEIIDSFINGNSINDLSEKFDCSKVTITRYLKKGLNIELYKELIKKNNNKTKREPSYEQDSSQNYLSNLDIVDTDLKADHKSEDPLFIEIVPLEYEIDNIKQRDLSSIPISEVDFPRIVYMIVDKKIELQTKYLKDYPDWQFLSQDELGRKTIEIFVDLKNAKRFCNKDEKVIKVPNPEVFKIVAPLLLSRGISRIISSDQLIAL